VRHSLATPGAGQPPQARWLRFEDPSLEAKFLDERVVAGRLRVRVLTVVAMIVTAAIGWNDVRLSGHLAPDFFRIALPLRLFVVVPAWFLIFLLTFLPLDRRRTDWVNAVATILACWGLALMSWHHSWFYPHNGWQNNLQLDLLSVLLISAFALPFQFRHIAAVALLSLGGANLLCRLTMPDLQDYNIDVMTAGQVGIGLCTVVMSWWRESGDRAMFAQREHAHRLAERLAASNTKLERLSAEQAEFMAIAAHDLRAPLAVVRGLSELMASGRLNEERSRNAVEEIGRQVTRMLGLVTDYLGAHAAEGRAAEARPETTDLAAAAREAAARHAAGAQAKGQALACDPAAAAVHALADPAMLAQVLDNFVTNAIKFSPAGAVIRLSVGRAAGGARVSVTDSGPGIPAEEQARLFQKFSRASTRPTAGESSHGLGLAVSRRLAEAMQGRVGCESRPGEGSTFWIELPRAG
jgi:signal transduction histidine kinase